MPSKTINIEELGKLRNKNENFWMFHRIELENNEVSDIYYKRNMAHTYKELINIIDKAIKKGKKFGSIEQALKNKNVIHLTFDDGYKEHLVIAKRLKEKYNFSKECITFSINIRNSFYKDKLSMDMIYSIIEDDESLKKLCNKLDIGITSVNTMKDKIFGSKEYMNILNEFNINTEKYFLNELDVISISKLFSVASHCINHCYLTTMTNRDIIYELQESKSFLEKKLNISIDTICYPDGKSDENIEKLSSVCDYKYGLSISSSKNNPYKIGRSIP